MPKLLTPTVSASLVKVFNSSLENGICPPALKLARVTPIHKNGPRSDPNNYRPIFILPVLFKLLEKHVCSDIMQYLRSHNLIICAVWLDDWLEAMDRVQFTGAVFIDFRKAFDVVHHEILLKKLHLYGFSDPTLEWFKIYLLECNK